MIRTKGEAGTGNIIEAVRHQRMVIRKIKNLNKMNEDKLQKIAQIYSQSYVEATKKLTSVDRIGNKTFVFEDYTYENVLIGLLDILKEVKKLHRLPVVNFAAGGIATPSDAALMMQLGSDGVFVGSGIFKSKNPEKRAKAIVEAVTNFNKPEVIAEVSKNLGDAMAGIEIESLPKEQMLQERGW